MTHANSFSFDEWINEARDVKVADVLRGRGIKAIHELNMPCPACGGIDRFAINTMKNIFICRASGAGGDAIALLGHLDATSFLASVEALTGRPPPGRIVAESPAERAAREAELARREAAREAERARELVASDRFREDERRRCHEIWKGARPIAGTPVESYLALRGLALFHSLRLRFLPNQALWDKPAPRGKVVHRGPAMVAPIVRPDGHFGGIHMTWIDLTAADGKAKIPDPDDGELIPAKKVRGSKKGGRIVIGNVLGGLADDSLPLEPTRLVLGEGIETVMSLRQELARTALGSTRGMPKTAFWSGVDLGNIAGKARHQVSHSTLRRFDSAGRSRPLRIPGAEPAIADEAPIPIPDSVTELILLRDMDSDAETTGFAMRRAAARYATLRPDLLITEWRPKADQDFNDALREMVA